MPWKDRGVECRLLWHAGCTHEIRHLVAEVPFRRCLLVVNASTNQAFLDEILAGTAASLHPGSPNFGRSLEDVPRFTFGTAHADTRRLIRRLADTTGG